MAFEVKLDQPLNWWNSLELTSSHFWLFFLICLSVEHWQLAPIDLRKFLTREATLYYSGRNMVLCFQNCPDLLWDKIVLDIEKNFWNLRLMAKNLQNIQITRTIYSSSERSEQILVTECLEQSEFKLEKIIGILKHAGKVRKIHIYSSRLERWTGLMRFL